MYGFVCFDQFRTVRSLSAVPCVSFRLIRNTGTQTWPVWLWRGDLRRRTEHPQPPDYRTYSPEVTSLRSNLPVHRSVNASGCAAPLPRVLAYNNRKPPCCQGGLGRFFVIFARNFQPDFCVLYNGVGGGIAAQNVGGKQGYGPPGTAAPTEEAATIRSQRCLSLKAPMGNGGTHRSRPTKETLPRS